MLRGRILFVVGAVCFIALTTAGIYRIVSLEARVSALEQSRLEVAARPAFAPQPTELALSFAPADQTSKAEILPHGWIVPNGNQSSRLSANRFPNGEPLPQGTRPFQFNGMTCYVVPLGAAQQ